MNEHARGEPSCLARKISFTYRIKVLQEFITKVLNFQNWTVIHNSTRQALNSVGINFVTEMNKIIQHALDGCEDVQRISDIAVHRNSF